MDPRVVDLYNDYIHGDMPRRTFLKRVVEIVREHTQPLALSKGDSVLLTNPRGYRILNVGSDLAEVLWIAFRTGASDMSGWRVPGESPSPPVALH